MKNQSETELLNKYNIHQQQAESGIIDILLGFVMLVIALGVKLHNPGVVVVLSGAFIILIKGIWRSKIYPRIPMEVSVESQPEKHQSGNYLILSLLVVILIGFTMINIYPKSIRIDHPLFNVMGVLISGMIILGGISRDQRFYLYGIYLAIPMIVLQFQYGIWFGMSLMIVIVLLLMVVIFWRVFSEKAESHGFVMHRSSKVAHSFLAEMGLVFFAYFLLATYIPPFADWLKQIVIENNTIVAGIGFSALILGIGISYLSFRYYLYSGLIAALIIITKTLPGKILSITGIFLIMGSVILALGLMHMSRFIARYPILKEHKAVSTEE